MSDKNPVFTVRIPGSSLAEVEKGLILATLASMGGSTQKAAEALDISQRKVQYRMAEYRKDPTRAVRFVLATESGEEQDQ